jgi:DNA polymerase delta subunit 1
MSTAVLKPIKTVLGDATKRQNLQPSPQSAKRRKLDIGSSPAAAFKRGPHGVNGKMGSSQPKSQFEEEVLEKLTQDANGLKAKNSEKDQQWERPGLEDFNEREDSLLFQQIEVEEGTLHGGRTTIKLFGVTEVSSD